MGHPLLFVEGFVQLERRGVDYPSQHRGQNFQPSSFQAGGSSSYFEKQKDGEICLLAEAQRQGWLLHCIGIGKYFGAVHNRERPYQTLSKNAGDFDIWKDKNGKGYIMFEHDHNGVIAAALTDDYLDVVGPYRDMFVGLKPPFTREGITHFEHKGSHYLLTSGMTGYIPNPSEVAVSDNPLGPYTPLCDPHRNDDSSASFNSQVSCITSLSEERGTFLVMADRWVPKYVMTEKRYQQILRVVARQSDKSFKPKLSDYLAVAGAPFLGSANTSIAEYVWLPMCFEGDKPVIDWFTEWKIEDFM